MKLSRICDNAGAVALAAFCVGGILLIPDADFLSRDTLTGIAGELETMRVVCVGGKRTTLSELLILPARRGKWVDLVRELMEQSTAILAFPGFTEGLAFELLEASRLDMRMRKLILLSPRSDGDHRDQLFERARLALSSRVGWALPPYSAEGGMFLVRPGGQVVRFADFS